MWLLNTSYAVEWKHQYSQGEFSYGYHHVLDCSQELKYPQTWTRTGSLRTRGQQVKALKSRKKRTLRVRPRRTGSRRTPGHRPGRWRTRKLLRKVTKLLQRREITRTGSWETYGQLLGRMLSLTTTCHQFQLDKWGTEETLPAAVFYENQFIFTPSCKITPSCWAAGYGLASCWWVREMQTSPGVRRSDSSLYLREHSRTF